MGLLVAYIGIQNTRSITTLIRKYFIGDDVWVSNDTYNRLHSLYSNLIINNIFNLITIDKRFNLPHPNLRTTYNGHKLDFKVTDELNNTILSIGGVFMVLMIVNCILPCWVVVLVYTLENHSEIMNKLENINRYHMGVPEITDTKVSNKLKKFFNIN